MSHFSVGLSSDVLMEGHGGSAVLEPVRNCKIYGNAVEDSASH